MTHLWGPIDPSQWRAVPCVVGRRATEEDVVAGRAVFYVQGYSEAAQFNLPCCGLQLLEDGSEEPVIVIQAERAPYGIILGLRPLNGGNSVCMETDVRLLPLGFD